MFCLKVDDAAEYFANGILVHNCDELAAYQKLDDVWDMMMMGLRLGRLPRVLATTTPRPKDLVRQLIAEHKADPDDVLLITGSTYENKANIAKSFFKNLAKYEGTKLGRQELHAQVLDDEGDIIQRDWIGMWPADKKLPVFSYVIMSLDTAFTQKTLDKKTHDADPTACQVWGLFEDPPGYNNVILVDAWDDHLGFPDLLKRVKREKDIRYGEEQDKPLLAHPLFQTPKRPHDTGRAPDVILIEEKGSGISLRQALAYEGIDTQAYNPGRQDKLTRLHAVSHLFCAGRIWMMESRDPKRKGQLTQFGEAVLRQLTTFKGEGSIKHDDHVDACTQAIRYLSDRNFMPVSLTAQEMEEDASDPPAPFVNPYRR